MMLSCGQQDVQSGLLSASLLAALVFTVSLGCQLLGGSDDGSEVSSIGESVSTEQADGGNGTDGESVAGDEVDVMVSTRSSTRTATLEPTPTPRSTATPYGIIWATRTNTPTITPTPTATATFTPTATNTATATSTPGPTSTPLPTATGTPTRTGTSTSTPTSTVTVTPTTTPVPCNPTPGAQLSDCDSAPRSSRMRTGASLATSNRLSKFRELSRANVLPKLA